MTETNTPHTAPSLRIKKFRVDPILYEKAVHIAADRGEVLAEVLRDRVATYVIENTDRLGRVQK